MAVGNASAPARRFTDQDADAGTRVDAGLKIKGTVTGSVPVDISGAVEGKIEAGALVWLREGGRIHGQVIADSVVIEGHLEGTVSARERVELRASCKVKGDIDAKTVAIAEGSFFEGRIRMGSGGPTSFQEKRKA